MSPDRMGGGNTTALSIAIGERWVALDAHLAREILGRPPLTKLPNGPSGLVGVLAWRGRAIAVLDLGVLLDEGSDVSARPRTVVIELGSNAVAIPVDRVREARAVDEVRAAHAARMPFSSREVDIDGTTMPFFEVSDWLASLSEA